MGQNNRNKLGVWAGPGALVGVFLLVAGLVLWRILGSYQPWMWALWGGGALCLLLAGWWGLEGVLRWVSLRGTAVGTQAAVMSVLVLGIVVIVNVIVRREDFAKRFDLTKNRRFTLSGQTHKILGSLDAPVTIKAFYGPGAPRAEALKDLLHEYDVASDKVDIDVIDPKVKVADAEEAKQLYGLAYFPASVVIMGDRSEKVSGTEEQDFTSAILKLTSPEVKKIYFANGHGERDANAFEEAGYSAVTKELKNLNREVLPLDLKQNPSVPTDSACLIIAGPNQDFEPRTVQAVDDYLRSQGKLLLLLDPLLCPQLALAMEKWGFKIGNDVVMDLGSNYLFDFRYPYVSAFEPAHEITRGSKPAYFPLSRSVEPSPAKEPNMRASALIQTGKVSWSEMDISSKRAPKYDEGQDVRGPISIASVSEEERPGETPEDTPGFGKPPTSDKKGLRTRLVVVGDSDFAANQFTSDNVYHADLFVNMVNWLLQEEELVSIAPKEKEESQILISDLQLRWVFWICVIVVPVGLLLTGGMTWWRRR